MGNFHVLENVTAPGDFMMKRKCNEAARRCGTIFGRHKPDTGPGKEKNATGRMITVIENFLINIMPAPKIFRLLPIFYFFSFF